MNDQSQNWQASRLAASTTNASASQRRNDESWVEISSQPSSSSLSSIGDEIITTGLQVSGAQHPHRRRRSYPARYPFHNAQGQFQVGGMRRDGGAGGGGISSQEEYEASESEEEHNLASSTENLPTQLPLSSRLDGPGPAAVESATDEEEEEEEEEDDDENATALGSRRRSNDHSFRPQPNAFSNPPPGMLSAQQRSRSMNAAHPQQQHQHPHSPVARRPLGTRTQTRVRPQPNYMSSAYQADNDAALRASLTTLLSCAAAARGLPKPPPGVGARNDDKDAAGLVAEPGSTAAPGAMVGGGSGGPAGTAAPVVVPPGSNQPVELRLVAESELMAAEPLDQEPRQAQAPQDKTAVSTAAPSSSSRRRTSTTGSSSPRPASSRGSSEKGKRAAAATPARTLRASKKKRILAGATGTGTEDAYWATTAGDGGSAGGGGGALISPTLMTWVVSAGVVVLVSVVGFGAGYVIGRDVGRQEVLSAGSSSAGSMAANVSDASSCGRDVMRSSAGGGLRRWRWGSSMRAVSA